jgi:hypothetical protein
MQRLVSTLALLGVLAGLTSSDAHARLLATKTECLSACGAQVAASCGAFPRGRANRCRLRLVRQCRKFGPEMVCPAPTTTTLLATTTTTTPNTLLSPTTTTQPTSTTTLPPIPTIPDVRGDYTFRGVVTSDTCGGYWDGSYVVSVNTQIGADLAGWVGLGQGTGSLYDDGSWTLQGNYCNGTCWKYSVAVAGVEVPTPAVAIWHELRNPNSSFSSECQAEAVGTLYPLY